MNPYMKKSIAILLLVPAIVAHAEDWTPSKDNLARANAASEFSNKLLKAALPPGKSAESVLSYVADEKHWICHVAIKGTKASVDVTDPSPDRACVQAVLTLARQGAI